MPAIPLPPSTKECDRGFPPLKGDYNLRIDSIAQLFMSRIRDMKRSVGYYCCNDEDWLKSALINDAFLRMLNVVFFDPPVKCSSRQT